MTESTSFTSIAIMSKYLDKGYTIEGLTQEWLAKVLADHVMLGGSVGTWRFSEYESAQREVVRTVVGFYAARDGYMDGVTRDVTITHCWVGEVVIVPDDCDESSKSDADA